FRTGDQGVLDAEGYLALTGRGRRPAAVRPFLPLIPKSGPPLTANGNSGPRRMFARYLQSRKDRP
ncbi:MAG: hypothetical protein ACREH6_12695, partial [Geminicoccaceae bacterium]